MKWAFLAAALLAIGLVQLGAMSVWVVGVVDRPESRIADRRHRRPGCRPHVRVAPIQDPDQP